MEESNKKFTNFQHLIRQLDDNQWLIPCFVKPGTDEIKLGFSHLPRKIDRLPWHTDEDKLIKELVSTHGKGQWTRFAKVLNSIFYADQDVRKPKEIRSRFINRLDP